MYCLFKTNNLTMKKINFNYATCLSIEETEYIAMAALWENSCNLSQKKIGRHQIEVPRHLKKALLCRTCCNWTLNIIVLHIFPATSMLFLETWPVTLQNLKLLLRAKYANNSHVHIHLFLHQLAANPEH